MNNVVQMTTVIDWVPVIAAMGALFTAVQAWRVSRNKPQLDQATTDKIKQEISKEQEVVKLEVAKASARRDLYLIRLENWVHQKMRPAWRLAVRLHDEQNELLVQLAARAHLEFEPKHLPELPDPPTLGDLDDD